MSNEQGLVENYGQAWLDKSEWPDLHSPHRCGDAPFVPVVDGTPRQHSCGSYAAGFNEAGCNKYRPNYPDDMWLEQNGCAGLADCKDGVPPQGDIVKEGTFVTDPAGRIDSARWPADGFMPALRKSADCSANASNIEGFASLASPRMTRTLLWVALILAVSWFGCSGGGKK